MQRPMTLISSHWVRYMLLLSFAVDSNVVKVYSDSLYVTNQWILFPLKPSWYLSLIERSADVVEQTSMRVVDLVVSLVKI